MHISIWNHKRASFLSITENESDFLQNFIWVLLYFEIRLNIHETFVGLLCSIVLKQNSKILGGHFTVVLMIIDQFVNDTKNLIEDKHRLISDNFLARCFAVLECFCSSLILFLLLLIVVLEYFFE